MYVGKIVETAPTEKLFTEPKHPYTQALLSAVPIPNPEIANRAEPLKGEVADPANPPSGCYFHPRCPFAQEICRTTEPLMRELSDGHATACHFAEDLELPGVPE
jgi:peptide/nickel transport system ATP-binding protein